MDKKKIDELRELKGTSQGNILLEYIGEKVSELDTVVGAKDWNEVLGRQEAVKKLKEIFTFLGALENKPDSATKSQYL
jgi:hypothetical protein